MINGHGNNPHKYKDKINFDFSSNIAFNNKSEKLLKHLQSRLPCLSNYPDPVAKSLTKKIAKHCQISEESVLVTNGSAEAFYLIAHFFAKAQSLVCIPSFSEYEDACSLYKHRIDYIYSDKFSHHDFSPYQSVWLGNPNNPDSICLNAKLILAEALKYPETYFIVDQAYAQLTSQKDIDLLEHESPKNLILIHSLTKEFAIPGLRLGYITASAEFITAIAKMRPPWNVNALALEAGEFIMDNYAELLPNLEELLGESIFLQRELGKIKGLEVLPSSCNFFISKLSKGTAPQLKEELIKKHGILIRDASNFRGLDASYFRVAAQDRPKNLKLLKAVEEVLSAF